jgi:transcriptional regulator with XRE-family HTH domain
MRTFSPEHMSSRRRRLGKTQRRLSQEVGISQGSISALEKGRKEPRSTTLAKLAHALECSVDTFFA